jgi:histidine triad (HIT) family protein
VFCAIVAGTEPASFVYQDEDVVAFLSLDQPTPFKVLVLPRAHAETIYDLSDAQAAALLRAAVRVARAVRHASACAGLNLVQSNGAPAGQDVPHFHMHLIPRTDGDGVVLNWPVKRVGRETLDGMAAQIRAKLEATGHE